MWQFSTLKQTKLQGIDNYDLVSMSDTKIRRHIKIRKDAHPFKSEFREYFEKRNRHKSYEGKRQFMEKCILEMF